jgi:hypothetical protein
VEREQEQEQTRGLLLFQATHQTFPQPPLSAQERAPRTWEQEADQDQVDEEEVDK